jgi:CD109 antigen
MRLDMKTKKSAVFVQTDKSIYKTADKVQFRILVLNADTKPYENANVIVFISDGAQNRVKQFDNVKMTKGVFQNELQISDLPVLGIWKIHVKVNDEEETTKDFEVAEYTLPKFEVSIDANPDANLKDGKIRATVRAKYTFGKNVKGNATVTAEVLKPFQRHWLRVSLRESRKVSKSVAVDGKRLVEFDIESELGIKEKIKEAEEFEEAEVKLFAAFKEELTGREQTATAIVTIHLTPHKIELKTSSENFKPGLPFSIRAIVKHHDKGAPVSDKLNPLKITIIYLYDFMRSCNSRTGECREVKSYKEIKDVFVTNGIAKVDIDIASNTTKIGIVARYLGSEGTKKVERSESANNQYIQIKSPTER